MVRKATKTPKPKTDESDLTKGQFRKLTALRKSLGPKIADKAFAEWFKKQAKEAPTVDEDQVATVIAEAIEKALAAKQLRMQRGGYVVKRGRGRIIVEPAA